MNEENNFTIETAGEDRAAVIETKEPVIKASTENHSEAEKPQHKKPKAQKRIEGLVRNVKEEREGRRQEAAANLELRAEIAELKQQALKKPDIVDFDEPEDYDDARNDYDEKATELKDKAKELEANLKEADKVDYDFKDTLTEINAKFEEAKDKYEDFDEIVKAGNTPFSQTIVETMNDFENSGDIAYALGSDGDELKRIAKLPKTKQIIEVLNFAKRMGDKKPKQKKQTKASEPIVPTLGAGGSREKTVHDADNFQDYSAMRTEQTVSKGGW